MASSTTKSVLIERFERETLRGFVNPQTWLQTAGIELLDPSGSVLVVPYAEVKTVYFVRDLDAAEVDKTRRLFHTRPRTEGLWIRMLFRDGDYLDGLLPNSLLQLDPHGFTVLPPEPSANNQRVFVPRAALSDLKVLGVIGGPLRRRKRVPPSEDQIRLFE